MLDCGVSRRPWCFRTEEEKRALSRSHNDVRRHLTESQRAMRAGRVSQLKNGTNQHKEKEGVTRVTPTKTTAGDAAKNESISRESVRRHLSEIQRSLRANDAARLKYGTNQHAGKEEVSKDTSSTITISNAAKKQNVSVTSVIRARCVTTHGIEELQAASRAGRVSQLKHGTNQHEEKVDGSREPSTNVSTEEGSVAVTACAVEGAQICASSFPVQEFPIEFRIRLWVRYVGRC